VNNQISVAKSIIENQLCQKSQEVFVFDLAFALITARHHVALAYFLILKSLLNFITKITVKKYFFTQVSADGSEMFWYAEQGVQVLLGLRELQLQGLHH
jgi:hypothetical protein